MKKIEYKQKKLKILRDFQKSSKSDTNASFILFAVFIALLIGMALYIQLTF